MTTSVVIATYNGDRYIQEQILSIINGSKVPNEIVIVDDSSSDHTLDIIQGLQREDPALPIKILRNPSNQGVTASFFSGISASSGEAILLSDQDDRWMSMKLASLVSEFEKDPATIMAYSDAIITDRHMQDTGRTIFSTRSKAHLSLGQDRPKDEVASNPDIKGCSMAISGSFARDLVRRSDPQKVGKYWGHDHWLALFAYGTGRVKATSVRLFEHRFHDRNASGGSRFAPLSIAHWIKWGAQARLQSADHYVQRYSYALQVSASYGDTFDKHLTQALNDMLAISERRMALKTLRLVDRISAAWQLHREGVYLKHYNGIFTLLRDTTM